MTETRGSVRQRKARESATANPPPPAQVEEVDTDEAEEIERERDETETVLKSANRPPKQKLVDEDDEYTPWVDILRVLSFLAFASCALSYLISGGESYTWGGQMPKYLQTEYWRAQFKGPIYLTPAELASYDGADETKPLYLAINGTIYDVSENRRTYGPGGSYQFFAGADAARSYVTGCFKDDRNADLRGVEDMYLPLDDPETDAHWPAAELAELRRQEREKAEKRVYEALLHWVKFFENNARYPKVGYVKREKDWLEKEPRKTLCKSAAKGRKKRTIPE